MEPNPKIFRITSSSLLTSKLTVSTNVKPQRTSDQAVNMSIMAKYKSSKGCCICGIKSSNSRFTSSEKYEKDFPDCFKLEARSGEICNPCVLSVKRWRTAPNKDFSHMVDKKRNGGPRNLKTILKREKKARERNSAHGSRRRKPQHPVCLRNSHPDTVQAFEQIKMRIKREQLQDPSSYDSRIAVMTFLHHSRRCQSAPERCRHTFTSLEAREEEQERLFEEADCDCHLGWYWLPEDVEVPPCKHRKASAKPAPDTGDESGIESAGFDSTRSTSC